jgi:heat shock protein HslJ
MLNAPPAFVRVMVQLPLKNTYWYLVTVKGRKLDAAREVSFTVRGHQISVNDGCNSSGSSVSITATNVRSIDPQIKMSTGIACLKAPPLFALFRHGARYQIHGRTLTLTGYGKRWTFSGVPLPPVPLPPSPVQP